MIRSKGVTAVLLAVVALLCILPALVLRHLPTDSANYNQLWLAGFTDEIAHGASYPRWLYGAWGGFGSPTFYFYPPLYFYLVSLVRMLSGGLASLDQCSAIVFGITLVLSGLGMDRLLRNSGSRLSAIGACAFMIAPYHLNEYYLRGAIAESCCYAILPWLLIGMRALTGGSLLAVPVVACLYGLLLFAHLPVALLASLTLLPAYGLFLLARRKDRRLIIAARLAAAVLLGAVLAAAYVLPALTLLHNTSTDAMWTMFFTPRPWFFWSPSTWPDAERMHFLIPVTLGITLLGAAVLLQRKPVHMPEAIFWAGLSLVGGLLIAGVFPPFWSLPMIEKVQFPWRMLTIVELSAIAALALTPRIEGWLAGAGTALIVIGAMTGLYLAATTIAWTSPSTIRAEDGPEYLPNGYPIPITPGRPVVARSVMLPPLTAPIAPGGHIQAETSEEDGRIRTIDVTSTKQTVVIFPRFYFPNWRITDGKEAAVTFACTRYRLLCWRSPAGRRSWRVASSMLPVERIACAVSAAALMAILGILSVGLYAARRQEQHVDRPAWRFGRETRTTSAQPAAT